MSEAAVRDILQQIERLSPQDRLDLSMRLAEDQEREWKAEAETARRAASERGITQAVIDQAVHDVRRGT
jgi:hypothetical protein